MKTHGCTRGKKTPEYISWLGMKKRCYNPTSINYNIYGGRGIVVCERWKNSFVNFLADMGLKPSCEYSLDRIDSNGNYEPLNCRWATWSEQMKNRRPFKLPNYPKTRKPAKRPRGVARVTVQQ